jgi:hypothetical protein
LQTAENIFVPFVKMSSLIKVIIAVSEIPRVTFANFYEIFMSARARRFRLSSTLIENCPCVCYLDGIDAISG